MPTVIVNGERRQLPEGATSRDAVADSGAEPGGRGMAVAVEGEVVPRSEWDATELSEGQRVEVLQAVQGG